jgi:hypothetical protein
MANAGKWLARDLGSFDPPAFPAEPEPVTPKVFPLAERLTAQELILLYGFRASLPPGKVVQFPA